MAQEWYGGTGQCKSCGLAIRLTSWGLTQPRLCLCQELYFHPCIINHVHPFITLSCTSVLINPGSCVGCWSSVLSSSLQLSSAGPDPSYLYHYQNPLVMIQLLAPCLKSYWFQDSQLLWIINLYYNFSESEPFHINTPFCILRSHGPACFNILSVLSTFKSRTLCGSLFPHLFKAPSMFWPHLISNFLSLMCNWSVDLILKCMWPLSLTSSWPTLFLAAGTWIGPKDMGCCRKSWHWHCWQEKHNSKGTAEN